MKKYTYSDEEQNINTVLVHQQKQFDSIEIPHVDESRISESESLLKSLGYRLIAEGTLYGTKARGKMYCSKSDLIDYLSSESTLRNPTCEGYRSLVRAFKRKRSDDTYNEQRRERRRIEREKKGSDT